MNSQKEMTYRKLFNIHYNNKIFTIFIDEFGRRTFLELDNSGKYIYPLFGDFIQLHKIYNERDIFTLYDHPFYAVGEHLPDRPRKMTFKEFVRVSTGDVAYVLAGIMIINTITGTILNKKMTLAQSDGQITITVDYMDGALINNTTDLDNALGYKTVSIEDVINVINQNDKIGEEYKKYAISLVTFIKNKYPNTDSRIFYENMKDCLVKIETADEMGERIAGQYSSNTNIISIKTAYMQIAEVIIHEFAHAYHVWKENTIYMPKYRIENIGHSLDEAMTNKIISGILPTHTYNREKKLLNYLLSCVDYDYYDYESEGIAKLINLLKEKYQTVDIDYIINSVDAMRETYNNTGEVINLEESLETLDEMFNICICNINLRSNSVYQPFIDFLKLIDYTNYRNIAEEYLKRYNNMLLEKGYDQTKVEINIQNFINEIDYFESAKSDFERICSGLDINTVSQDNIYRQFKDYYSSLFVQYFSEDEAKNFFYDILDIYNDFLYRNGYTRFETITSEDMKIRMKKFEGVKIVGYVVTSSGNLYPIIDINYNMTFYNRETKILTLNEEGKVVLIDKDNTIVEEVNDNNDFQYRFISGLFDNLDNGIIKFDENFWQYVFKLEAYQYEGVPIYLDGEQVAEEYLKIPSAVIGQEENETNTFTIIESNSRESSRR